MSDNNINDIDNTDFEDMNNMDNTEDLDTSSMDNEPSIDLIYTGPSNFDEEEYISNRKKRDLYVEERRQNASKKRALQRKLIILGFSICLGILVIVLIVTLIKNAVNKKENTKTPKVETTTTDISSIVTTETIPEPTPEPTPTIDTSYLGYNSTVTDGAPKINGTDVFPGYTPIQTKDTYYIDSANVLSTYAILINAQTGDVVCQREGFTRINPASMTKILTVLVAAEHLKEEDLDKEVTITPEDVSYSYKNDLSCVGFTENEVVTVRDLFYGTILPSGADAAIALAEYVAGDRDVFIDMLNDKISELGLKNTHFTNCVGLYNEDHYTTCAEMAMIIKAAVENEFVYEIMNAHKYTTTPSDSHPSGIEISNWFLRRIEDKDTAGEVLCAKTGFVNESGCCAASYSLQNNKTPYICVTANAWSSWRCIYDHVDLYLNNTDSVPTASLSQPSELSQLSEEADSEHDSEQP